MTMGYKKFKLQTSKSEAAMGEDGGGGGAICCLVLVVLIVIGAISSKSGSSDPPPLASVPVKSGIGGWRYIEIKSGQSVELYSNHRDCFWELPNNEIFLHFSKAKRAARVTKGNGYNTLVITNAQDIDTGLYRCIAGDNVVYSIYLFVQGSSFFVGSRNDLRNESRVTIPCRASSHPGTSRVTLYQKTDLRSFFESNDWTSLDASYDPRTGFEIIPRKSKIELDIGASIYKCETTFHSSTQFYLQPRIDAENYVISLVQNNDRPFVTGTLELSCFVKRVGIQNDTAKHFVISECARCADSTVSSFSSYWHNKNTLINKTTIKSLTTQDSGMYKCILYVRNSEGKDELIKETSRWIDIVERIKLMNGTNAIVEVNEGEPIKISGVIRTFSSDAPVTARWKRLFVRAHLSINETESIGNGKGREILEGEYKYVDVAVELQRSTLVNSGRYRLEISAGSASVWYTWTVNVKAKEIVPQLNIVGVDNWDSHDGEYYAIGSKARVLCYVEGSPIPEVRLLMRKISSHSNSAWNEVIGAIPIEGTFSKGFVADFTATDDAEYKCEGRSRGKDSFSKTVKVQVVKMEVSCLLDKGPSCERGHISVGDTVQLQCVMKTTDLVKIQWYFEVSAQSTDRVFVIENVTSSQAGNYMCFVYDSTGRRLVIVTRTIKVEQPVAPHIPSPVDPRVIVNYGESSNLTCAIEGMPEPVFQWFKNGLKVSDPRASMGNQLLIADADSDQDGNYTCMAANRSGKKELKFDVVVRGVPTFKFAHAILILCVIIIVISLVAGVFLCRYKNKKHGERFNRNGLTLSQLQEQAEALMQMNETNTEEVDRPSNRSLVAPIEREESNHRNRERRGDREKDADLWRLHLKHSGTRASPFLPSAPPMESEDAPSSSSSMANPMPSDQQEAGSNERVAMLPVNIEPPPAYDDVVCNPPEYPGVEQ